MNSLVAVTRKKGIWHEHKVLLVQEERRRKETTWIHLHEVHCVKKSGEKKAQRFLDREGSRYKVTMFNVLGSY